MQQEILTLYQGLYKVAGSDEGVLALLPAMRRAAIERYEAAPVYHMAKAASEAREAVHLCNVIEHLLNTKFAAAAPAQLPEDQQQQPAQQDPNAQAAPVQQDPNTQLDPATGQPITAPAGPSPQVDQAALTIEQALASGAQISAAEIIQALQEAAHQDLAALQAQIDQGPAAIDGQLAMHTQRLLGSLPQSTQIGTGQQLLNAGFGTPPAQQQALGAFQQFAQQMPAQAPQQMNI